MDKIEELEALILRLQQAYAKTNVRKVQDRLAETAHTFHVKQQKLIADNLVT